MSRRRAGFEATVRRGVYATREEAHLAAEEKTLRNVTAAIARLTKRGAPQDKPQMLLLRADQKASKDRLKALKQA